MKAKRANRSTRRFQEYRRIRELDERRLKHLYLKCRCRSKMTLACPRTSTIISWRYRRLITTSWCTIKSTKIQDTTVSQTSQTIWMMRISTRIKPILWTTFLRKPTTFLWAATSGKIVWIRWTRIRRETCWRIFHLQAMVRNKPQVYLILWALISFRAKSPCNRRATRVNCHSSSICQTYSTHSQWIRPLYLHSQAIWRPCTKTSSKRTTGYPIK
jgi:hypothetical protein